MYIYVCIYDLSTNQLFMSYYFKKKKKNNGFVLDLFNIGGRRPLANSALHGFSSMFSM